jgi:hypothetical protein
MRERLRPAAARRRGSIVSRASVAAHAPAEAVHTLPVAVVASAPPAAAPAADLTDPNPNPFSPTGCAAPSAVNREPLALTFAPSASFSPSSPSHSPLFFCAPVRPATPGALCSSSKAQLSARKKQSLWKMVAERSLCGPNSSSSPFPSSTTDWTKPALLAGHPFSLGAQRITKVSKHSGMLPRMAAASSSE